MKYLFFIFFLSFSAICQECKELQQNLKFLTSDRLLGRVPGTPEHAETEEFIFNKLNRIGAVVFKQDFPQGSNLWGVLYPQNRREGLPQILISAHYDHLENCSQKYGAYSSVCNGAADNAGGIAALFNILEKLKTKINKPVAFAIFDREEEGLIGSRYFAKSNLLPSIKLVLNMDIIGLNTFVGMENVHLTMGSETGGEKLIWDLNQAAKKSNLDTYHFSYALAHGRGDLTNFIYKGIPAIHFTDGDGSVYHSSADEFQNLNQGKIIKISNLIANLTLLAEKNGPYPFQNPFKGENVPPTFEDIKVGKAMVEKIYKNEKSKEIYEFLKGLEGIYKKGERKFSLSEMSSFQKIAYGLMDYSRNLVVIPQGSKCED